MSKRPWMPFYVEDFRLDTLDLAPDELGVYFIMICLAWRRGDGSVPADMGQLKTMLQRCIAHFHGHSFNRIVPKLLSRFFCQQDGLWYQKRVVNELQKADKLSAKQSQNAGKRWAKNKENNGLADASAMPLQSQSQSQEKKPKKVSSTRKHVLPADWTLPIEGSAYARSKGWSEQKIDTEAIRFRDHALAHNRLQADWAAAWRNWVTSPFQKPEPTNGNRGQGHRSGGDAFFAGLASVAADIAGDGPVAERADPHIPPGRYEIDG